jgi:hypothetical protein
MYVYICICTHYIYIYYVLCIYVQAYTFIFAQGISGLLQSTDGKSDVGAILFLLELSLSRGIDMITNLTQTEIVLSF